MAQNSEEENDKGLDEVFRKLQVDNSWRDSSQSRNVLPESHCSDIFKGKINKRSPAKEIEVDLKSHSKRMRPYETDDLPFGDSLTKLSFETEECKDVKCTCNRKHRTCENVSRNLNLNFAKACIPPDASSERKLIKDSRLKLHHQVKDHKIVLRAARLKLHQSKTNWYKGPVLRKSTAVKQNIFGSNKRGSMFDTLAHNKEEWALSPKAQTDNFTSATFKQQRLGGEIKSESQPQNLPTTARTECNHDEVQGHPCCCASNNVLSRHSPSACCPLHPGVCTKPCSCAEQARMDVQDYSVDELASYLDEFVYIPKKMSEMAEMMYT